MFDAESTNEDLLNKVRATQELPGTVEATGRIRGQWHEIVETFEGDNEAYAYWVALDDTNEVGYKQADLLDADPDAIDLDYVHLVEHDGEL